jgi:hypothetical protein
LGGENVCVIAVSPVGEKVAREVFERMWEANDDGFGMMYRAKGGVGIVKGIMDKDEAWEVYSRLPRVPHVLHFRLATHGGVRPELTHPFVVDEASPIVRVGVVDKPVLAHNGIWPSHALRSGELKLKGPTSDSRTLAAWLGKLTNGGRVEDALKERYYEVATAGRVVVMDPVTQQIYLVGDWIRDGGFFFSNTSYRGAPRIGTGLSCDYWKANPGWPIGIWAKSPQKSERAALDYKELPPPEWGDMNVNEVRPPDDWRLAREEEMDLLGLWDALWDAAEDEGVTEALEHLEVEDYECCAFIEGLAGALEIELAGDGITLVIRMWSGDKMAAEASWSLRESQLVRSFLRREYGVRVFLQETGFPVVHTEALRHGYEDVFGFLVDEYGFFSGYGREFLTPAEASRYWRELFWRKGA